MRKNYVALSLALWMLGSAPAEAATRWWIGATQDPTLTTNWGTGPASGAGASVPGTADDVCFSSSSNNPITIATSLTWGSVDFTNGTGTGASGTCTGGVGAYGAAITQNSATTPVISCNGSASCQFIMSGTATYAPSSASRAWAFNNASAGTMNFNPGGKTFGSITHAGTSAAAGVTTVAALAMRSDAILTSTSGNWTWGTGFSHSVGTLTATSTTARTMDCGTSTILVHGTLGSVWAITTSTNFVLSCGSGTVDIASAPTGTRTITFGEATVKSYGTVKIRDTTAIAPSGILVDFTSTGSVLDTDFLNFEGITAARFAQSTTFLVSGSAGLTVTGLGGSGSKQGGWVTAASGGGNHIFNLTGSTSTIANMFLNKITVQTGTLICNNCFDGSGNTTTSGGTLTINYPALVGGSGGDAIIGGL